MNGPPLPRALHNDPIAEYPDESKRPGLYHGKAQEQLSLRYVLGHLMKETGEYYGEIPDNMGQAELIIREVEGRLRNHNARQAVPRQQAAIDKLREAQQDLAKKLRDMIEERARRTGTSPGGDLFGGHPPGGGSNLDPFGRPQSPDGLPNNQGQEDGGHVGGGLYDPFIEIPENGEQKFIQDILKELRDRAGQAQRPESERDYIRRLLEQFQF